MNERMILCINLFWMIPTQFSIIIMCSPPAIGWVLHSIKSSFEYDKTKLWELKTSSATVGAPHCIPDLFLIMFDGL